MKFYMLDGNEKILCAVPSKDIISLYQNLNYHQADTIEGSLVLSEKYTSILNNVRYFAISDRESNHNFYLYRKTLVQVQNHEIAINGQGAFWDEMQGAYIKDRRPNQVTPADTIKLILGYSRWNVDYVDQMLEEEGLRRDMNFYYVSLLDALNTVYQTWQVDIEPYINIEGHQITRRYVKLYQQQGGNNGRRFVYGDNALTVTQQANEGSIFTALVGRGAGVEETDGSGNLTGGYSRKISFADVEWSKANGDPCDKPKGQEYVEWKESTELYGYSDGKPRIGIVNFDNEKDPAQLLKETWTQLQQVGVPLVQFQATVGDVGYLNLGETVTIVRYDLNIKYQTRVTGIKWNRCDEAKSQITIGVKAIQSTADKIAGLQQSVAQANVNADEAKSTANHAIVDGTGAVVNYGPNEPANPKEGDIWYDVQPDGTVVLKQYQNGQWVILIDDTTGQQIKNKVEAQQKELDQAVQDANTASAKADGLVAQVGDANTNAQKALAAAQQNKADLAQAKNDLANTKSQLSNVQSDLTGTKSSLAGAISNISQAQEDLKNTEQGLQGVKSDLANTKQSLANDEKNLTSLSEQAQDQGQSIVNIHNTQAGLAADIADVKGNVSSLQDTADGLQATVGTLNSDNLLYNSDFMSNIPGKAPNTDWLPVSGWLSLNSTAVQRCLWFGQNALQVGWINANGGFYTKSVKSNTPDPKNANATTAYDLSFLIMSNPGTYDVYIEASYTEDFSKPKQIKLGTINQCQSWTPQEYSFTVPSVYPWLRLKMVSEQDRGLFYLAQPMLVYGSDTPSKYISSNQPGQKMSSIKQTIDSIESTVQGNSGQISQVKQTADSLQSAVTNNSSDISTLKQTSQSLQSDIQNKTDISQFKQLSNGLQTVVEDIGTFLPDSDFSDADLSKYFDPWDTSTSLDPFRVITDDKEAGHYLQLHGINKTIQKIITKDYIKIVPTSDVIYSGQSLLWWPNDQPNGSFKAYLHYYDTNKNEIACNDYWYKYDQKSVWQDFSFTDTPPNNAVYLRIESTVDASNSSDDIYGGLRKLKLQNGDGFFSKISQLSQTSDSLTSQISNANNDISQLKQTAGSLSSQIGNANNDISSLKQRADSMETNISNNQNDISSLKQTATSLQSNIQSKTDISQFTQLSNAFQTVVEDIGAFLPDSDFSDTDLSKYYDPWDTSTSLDPFKVITDDKQAGHYLQLHGISKTIQKIITKDYIRIIPTSDITYSGQSLLWWNDPLNGSFIAYLHFYNANKEELTGYACYYRYDQKSVWQDFSYTVTPPSDAMYLRIESTVDASNSSGDIYGGLRKLRLQNGDGFFSKISQLSDDINLRVQKGDLISQINIEAGKTLIQSKNLYLDSDTVTFSGRAFIPSAAITDLSADKITAGTLNAGNVNIINLDVNKLVGDTTEFVRSGWTNAYGSHVQIDGGGVNISYGNWYTRFDSSGVSFKDGGDYLGEVTRIGMDGAPSWYNGLAFNAGGDAEFLAFGAQDYGNDNQNRVPSKLLWMRGGIDTYGYHPGWNFCDKVWAGQVGMSSIQYQDWNIHFEEVTGNNGFSALALVSGSGNGFYWGSDGSFGYVTGHGGLHNVQGSQIIYSINKNGGTCESWSGVN